MSIQKEPDKRDLRYLKLIIGRMDDRTENEIAADAEVGSPEALYQLLATDGFPVCPVCGATHVEEDHCNPRKVERDRRAQSGDGEPTQLPSAARAIPLFKQALDSLAARIDTLQNRKEYLQDERFVANDEHHHDLSMLLRGPMSDEHWEGLIEPLNQRGESEVLTLGNTRLVESVGATQNPQEPLTTLIAVYVLAGLPLEPLLKKLNFAPETVNASELIRHIEGEKVKKSRNGKTSTQHIPGLKTKAAQVAKLIRGRTLRPGPSTGELSPEEQNIIWYRQKREKDGVPDATIFKELQEKRGLSSVEYQRLKKFRLVLP